MARLVFYWTVFLATTIAALSSPALSCMDDKKVSGKSSAPAPAPDCSTVIYDMIDCVSYISDGSTDKAPVSTCCAGLKAVIAVSPDCLCDALASAAGLGIAVNNTRAKALPGACNVPRNAYHDCPSTPSPAPTPANPPRNPGPKPAPPTKPPSPPSTPSSPPSSSPSSGGGSASQAPAPAPSTESGAFSIGSPHLGLLGLLALSASFILV